MILVSKSILGRLIFYFFLLLALLAAVPAIIGLLDAYGYLEKWDMLYFQPYSYWHAEMDYLYLFWFGLGTFAVYFVLAYLFYVVLPLRKIVREMQAMLTGRQYHKIFTGRTDEVGVIAHFFNEVTKNIGSLAGSVKEHRRLSGELSMAAELQNKILPEQNPKIPGLNVMTKTRPAAEVGGDSFDFIPAENKTYMYVGDVTGHGVPAGLIMTMAHALIRVFVESKNNAYELMVETNKHLKSHIRENMFMTMVLLCWDHQEKKMTYVGAGHEYLLVFRSATGKCERIKSGGIALGMTPDNSKLIKEEELKLNEGDFILIFSDGIVEARNADDKMYGIDRLQEQFVKYAAQYDADEVHKHIAIDFASFVGEKEQSDDITLMVIKRTDKDTKTASTEWKDDKSEKAA